jgi:hypothetical protein
MKAGRRTMLVLAAIVVAVSAIGVAAGSAAEGRAADPNLVVILKGPGDLMAEPPIAGALCYETDLYNAHTDSVIGTGIDCLADITAVDNGFLVNRTTIFDFPQGKLYANGPTSVVPTTGGSPGVTHIVGDIPADGTNSIVGGTKRFANASGSVRLSGAVDMSAFPGTIGFDCIFVIDLD